MFGDNSFKAVIASDAEELFPVRLDFLRKPNDTVMAGDDRLEQPSALQKRQTAQVAAVEIEEIEGEEEDLAGIMHARLPTERPL